MRFDAVSLDDVRHVARLARLGLTDEQTAAITPELNSILEHMAVLQGVDTSGIAEYRATATPLPLRADHGPPIPLADPPVVFAPQMRDGFFVVPRLATHEDAEP